jgi:hypothetical protein
VSARASCRAVDSRLPTALGQPCGLPTGLGRFYENTIQVASLKHESNVSTETGAVQSSYNPANPRSYHTISSIREMPDHLPDLILARILNEHVYCPRLAYLEWVDRQFVDNADTADGTFVHRVGDRERAKPPDPSDAPAAQAETGEPPPSSSAVTVSSERLGLIAKVNLLGAWVSNRHLCVRPV